MTSRPPRILLVLVGALFVALAGSYLLPGTTPAGPPVAVGDDSATVAALTEECLARREQVMATATPAGKAALAGENFSKWCGCFTETLLARTSSAELGDSERERVAGEIMAACVTRLL